VAEGAPLLREYVGKTCIKGSNPFDSASCMNEKAPRGAFFIGQSGHRCRRSPTVSAHKNPKSLACHRRIIATRLHHADVAVGGAVKECQAVRLLAVD
jgi:hypothetical protein